MIFNDVDIEDIGLRVKFLDVISNARGYVFSSLADMKRQEGFLEAAEELYTRAYAGYQNALSACPNDGTLLCNCALVMIKLYCVREENQRGNEAEDMKSILRNADLDDPLLFFAQQYFKTAIQVNRKSALSYVSYARFLDHTNQMEEAETHYIEALVRDPNNVETLTSYANLLTRMGQHEKAQKFQSRADEVYEMMESLMPNKQYQNKFE